MAVVEYEGDAYVFYTNGIWKTDINGQFTRINQDNWGGMSKNSVVNFGKNAFVHMGKYVYHVDLVTGAKKIVNEGGWGNAKGCIPIS